MGKLIRSKNKKQERLPVDETKLNMGNTYSSPPDYYYDVEFDCTDCGKTEVWTAKQQKWWYEEAGGYFFATAVRCRSCREKIVKEKDKQESRLVTKMMPNQRGQADSPPRCSFVADATSLTPLRPAPYRDRYA